MGVKGWSSGPTVNVISLSNLEVAPSEPDGESTIEDAIMLDGPVYPLKEQFKELDYTYVRGVHNKAGIDRWIRVVQSDESGAELEREAVEVLQSNGWVAECSAANCEHWPE